MSRHPTDSGLSASDVSAAGFGASATRRTQEFNVGQGVIGFDDTGGPGPLVIAAPGMGDLRGEYRYLTTYLTAAGYRVVTLDLRGHGASSAQWDDFSAHAIGRDLLALMTHLNEDKAIIIGNSFTAGSALWAAHDAPSRVSATVLIGPVVRDPKNLPWYVRALLSLGLGGPWCVWFWTSYWTTLFPMRRPADFKRYRQALSTNLKEPHRMTALKTMIYLSKADTEGMLKKTGLPVLVIMGTKDADFPDPTVEAQWVANRVGAEVLLIHGAGHYPQSETPEQVGPAVVKFLKGLHS